MTTLVQPTIDFKESFEFDYKVQRMPAGTYLASSFLYINLGCHMMFILKNRLQAQSITPEKTSKIINELVSAIFKESFVKTMIIPQEPMAISTFKDLFRKLAHSSIMKLDNSSMEKLLLLIIMTLKKEVFLTSSPLELFSLTLGNMRILQQYAKSTPSEDLLEDDIKIFIQAASTYSFTQYMEVKEYLLSLLQSYQTKVINFFETGHQDEKGKLVFERRNAHNEMNIGSVKNHPEIKIEVHTSKLKTFPLKLWKNWKTSLVVDHVSEYEKQSQRRKLTSLGTGVKQKSLNEMFLLNSSNVTDFEVKLDLFEYEGSNKPKEVSKAQPSGVQSKKEHLSKQSGIKDKIEEEFKNINLDDEEELDLLEMMDS